MKKHIFSFALILMAFVTVLTGCSNTSAETTQSLSINDIKFDPLSYTGEITINGINVGQYPRNPQIFFLMDTEELIACKNMQCGAYQLPVLYLGDDPIPELADEVNVTGNWVEYEEDGQTVTLFGITKIEVKRNTMKLLTS